MTSPSDRTAKNESFLVSNPATWPMVLTAEETCLVVNLSRPTIRKMVRRGTFPAPLAMPGLRKLLWTRASLLEWLDADSSTDTD